MLDQVLLSDWNKKKFVLESKISPNVWETEIIAPCGKVLLCMTTREPFDNKVMFYWEKKSDPTEWDCFPVNGYNCLLFVERFVEIRFK